MPFRGFHTLPDEEAEECLLPCFVLCYLRSILYDDMIDYCFKCRSVIRLTKLEFFYPFTCTSSFKDKLFYYDFAIGRREFIAIYHLYDFSDLFGSSLHTREIDLLMVSLEYREEDRRDIRARFARISGDFYELFEKITRKSIA